MVPSLNGVGRRGRLPFLIPLLAAAAPAIISGLKVAGAAAAGGAISYGVKKALEKAAG